MCASVNVCRMSNTKEPRAALLPKCSTYNRQCHSALKNTDGRLIWCTLASVRVRSAECPRRKIQQKLCNCMFMCFTFSRGDTDFAFLFALRRLIWVIPGGRAGPYIERYDHAHLLSKADSVISAKSPSPVFKWSGS